MKAVLSFEKWSALTPFRYAAEARRITPGAEVDEVWSAVYDDGGTRPRPIGVGTWSSRAQEYDLGDRRGFVL